jgi:predicted metalloprotease
MGTSNAGYCLNDNTVYFDDVFVASQSKIAGTALKTDGDMAGVGIIAHEMGHAVAMQLGFRSRDSYGNEAVADCMAGVFARQSQEDGSLEDGDLDEAFFGMASAGDPTPEPTGNRRVDLIMAARIARGAHGTREQRMANFHAGFQQGVNACMAQMQRA